MSPLFAHPTSNWRKLLLFLLLFCTLPASPLLAQGNFVSRYFNRVLNDTVNNGQPKLLFYPTVAYAPETSWEFGFSSLYLFYAKRDTSNRLSEVNGWTFLTLEQQYGIWFDHAVYTDRNKWFFFGRSRYQRFPLLYYGIGPDTPADHTALVDADYLLLKQRALRKIKGSLFAGIEVDFQGLTRSEFIPTESNVPITLPLGWEGSQNLGLGLGIVYDNRHNVLNVRDGMFGELAFLHSNTAWGSDYNFQSVVLDGRVFCTVRPRQVLAAQVLGQFTSGDVPFNQLALLGGESMLRGYYLGRYRDRNLMAGQVEYRFLPFVDKRPFRRFGGVVFLATGTVYSEENRFNLRDFVVAGGAGIRFLVFPDKDVYTRFDVAFTREGPGFYLFVGEAF